MPRRRAAAGGLAMLPAVLLLLAAGASAKSRAPAAPPLSLAGEIGIAACGASGEAPAVLTPESECVQVEVELQHLARSHDVQFLYYEPDGSLYAATKEGWQLQPATRKSYHRSARVRHRLPIYGEQASILPGPWRVAVLVDEIGVAESSFRIEPPPLPQDELLLRGQELYLSLRYEKASEVLGRLLETSAVPSVRAHAAWWLALTQYSLGRTEALRETLAQLLEIDPTFAVSASRAREVGGEEVRSELEELRSKSVPQLYRKTAAPPELELSRAEKAPELRKRRALWKRVALYGAATLGAAGLVAAVSLGVASASLGDPAELELYVDSTRAERDAVYGSLCQGRIPLVGLVHRGHGPYELLVTLAQVGGRKEARVEGLPEPLDGLDRVVLKHELPATGPFDLELPALHLAGPGDGSANLRILGLLRDSRSAMDFSKAMLGAPLPDDIRNVLEVGTPNRLERIDHQTLFEVVIAGCQQRE